MITYDIVLPTKTANLKLITGKKELFLKNNLQLCTVSLADHFLKHTLEFTKSESDLTNVDAMNFEENEHTIDIGPLFVQFYSSSSDIYSMFWKKNVKYSKQFLCTTILNLYNLTTQLFCKAQLRFIHTTTMYYLLFKSPHSYDVETSLQYVFDEFNYFDSTKLKQKIIKAEKQR
jgi:hypothetical protein